MRARLFLVAACLFAGCSSQTRGELPGRATDEWSHSYTLPQTTEFQIVGADGSIDVQAGAGSTIDVKAERVVHAATDAVAQSVVSRVRITEDESAPERLLLRSDGLGGIVLGVQIEVNFHVTVPMTAKLRLHAANGSITVSNVGGTVVATTTNGSVTGTAVHGGIDARSNNGDVRVQMASLSQEPIDLRTSNGTIELALPPDANANLAVNVTNGKVDTGDLPIDLAGEQTKRRLRGRLNAGGTPIELSSSNGDVHLKATTAAGGAGR